MPNLFIGLISGTSADGIDAALVECDDAAPSHCQLRLGRTYRWDPALRARLVALGQGGDCTSLDELGSLDIQAATFTVRGKPHLAFRFDHDGKAEYFDQDGRPLKKAFIRMPVQYTRISSRFTKARKHPVLGRTRAHQGVDYGAPSGTPIMAAGDARVQFAGWRGGYGRAVILDHGRGHTTLYGHMSRFANIKTGQRVAQGTVIGYVGSTGLATGPHLHYEFRVNGAHRNPLAVTMPPPEPLRGKSLAQFRAQTSQALAKIRRVEDVIFAKADTGKGNKKA